MSHDRGRTANNDDQPGRETGDRHLKIIQALIKSVNNTQSKQEFLDDVVRFLQAESGCRFVGIRVLDEGGYIPYQSYLGFSREFWEAENMIQISKEDCSCTRIVSEKLLPCDLPYCNQFGSLCIPDTQLYVKQLTEEEKLLFRGACVQNGYRSVAIVPVRYGQAVLGIIHLADFAPDQISAASLSLVEAVAPLTGELLNRDRVENHLQISREQQVLLQRIVAGITNLAYVVDITTYRLFYLSDLIEELSERDLQEYCCYQVFGYSSPCPGCQNHKSQGEVPANWERYDSNRDRYYLSERKAITWPDGRLVEAAFVMDITAQRKVERNLQEINSALEQSVVELQQLSAKLEEEISEREAAEQEIQRFVLFFLYSRDITLFVDRADGRIIEANPAAERAYGYSREELLNKTVFDLRRPSEFNDSAKQMILAGTQGILFETVHRRKDGSTFPVEVNSIGEEVDGQKILFSVVRDITERWAAQQELKKANAHLENKIIERTRELQDLNAALEEEVTERLAAEESLVKLNLELEDKVKTRTQELQDINAALEEEVMERQAAQEALLENRERYEALVKQSSDAIAVVSFDTNRVVEVNDAFLRMFDDKDHGGYKAATMLDFGLVSMEEKECMRSDLLETGRWTAPIKRMQPEKSRILYAERTACLIRHRNHRLILFAIRDVTEQEKLQAEIRAQVELAAAVQKSLLPPDYDDSKLAIRTVFQPLNLVSGDFFGYHWSQDTGMLHGYLIDVTGHGVATALHASAVSTLLNEAMENEVPWTEELLRRLNTYLNEHFQDNIFVALMVFTFDFKRRELTCQSCGINYMLASSERFTGRITVPGLYLGVSEKLDTGSVTIPIQQGDTFYFITDGISENMPPEIVSGIDRFDVTVAALKHLTRENNHDDCSALCVQIKGMRPWPLYFDYSIPAVRQLVRQRISSVLRQIPAAEHDHAKIEVVVGEALTNAVRHGNTIRIKVNIIGTLLVIRVKDDGDGFAGNIKVKAAAAIGVERVFESLLMEERGRGIPVMMHWMDKVLYNRQGNEVMLVKRITA